MPQLAHGEWEHLFEPWFEDEAPKTPAPKLQTKRPESIFSEASQPLAVRRQDFIERQSPVSRALQLRSGHVAPKWSGWWPTPSGVTTASKSPNPSKPNGRHCATPRFAGWRRRQSRSPRQPRTSSRSLDPLTLAVLDSHRPEAPSARCWHSWQSPSLRRTWSPCSARRQRRWRGQRPLNAPQPNCSKPRSDAVTAASDRAQRAISEALTQAARAERMIQVMAAPDARRIELSGSGAAQAAVGQAFYSRARGVIVSATGVPRPAGRPGLCRCGPTTSTGSVSLGLASPDGTWAASRQRYDVTAPTWPVRFAGFSMTLEPPAGGSSSTGAVLLTLTTLKDSRTVEQRSRLKEEGDRRPLIRARSVNSRNAVAIAAN